MLAKQKITRNMVVMVSQPEPEKMFSDEFMQMIEDRAYETLRAYLKRTRQDDAVHLLDDLIILSMRFYGSAAPYVKDQMMSEAVAQASYHVLSLGGNWGE